MALLGGRGIKLELEARPQGLRPDEFLFSETGGFLIETDEKHLEALLALCGEHGADAERVGSVRGNRKLEIACGGDSVIDLDLERLEVRREAALGDLLR
jgi:phosphoribosylformylglycinamidine (FGAM) synthase-like enzyme